MNQNNLITRDYDFLFTMNESDFTVPTNIPESGNSEIDSDATNGENDEKIEIVYVDMPNFDFLDDTSIIIDEDPLRGSINEEMHTIYIEVPQVSAEESISYAELSNLKSEDLDTDVKNEILETDPTNTDGDISVRTIVPFHESDKPSRNCFLLHNGKNVQPLYIVKKLENLDKLESVTSSIKKEDDTENYITSIKKERVSNAIGVSSAEIKTGIPKSESIERVSDYANNEDLMWLLNFKLDKIFSNTSSPLRPLDDFPACQSKSSEPDKNKRDYSPIDNKKGKETNDDECESSFSVRKKPPFTYTELIECALQEKGPLTVSEIYQWISETFPYYKSWDDRWKNSVRHNLSINPYFRKGTKARQGSGHLWTVSKSAEKSKSWSWKRQRYQQFEEYTKRIRMNDSADEDAKEAALAAANIEDKENRGLHRDVLFATHNHVSSLDVTLEQTAEEILSGVKRNVEVQFLDTPKIVNADGNDFLNLVPKEELMGECDFLNQIELNLTAETTDHLGMVEAEQVFEIPEDLGFQYNDITSQGQQLLSLVN